MNNDGGDVTTWPAIFYSGITPMSQKESQPD
jgi:hypothetical protein